jgi:peptidoglycan/xylan/chitin deacetylase (PgdA/CDA1 family)
MLFMNYYRKTLLVLLCSLFSIFPQQVFAESDHCVLLVYHRFTDVGPKSTSVSPELFRSHLSYLQDNDFEVLPLDDVIDALQANTTLPNKCVSLTADDGYLSIHDNAYPLLKEFQMSMAIFVATEAIDNRFPAMMSWQQLDEMSDLVAVYNHGVSHSHLVGKESEEIAAEIISAQIRLKIELGTKTKFFAYPYGEFDDTTYDQLQALGYVGFGQQSGAIGVNSDRFNLPRYAMAGSYAKMSSFTLKVNSLPMPIASEQPKLMLISEGDRPVLTLKFTRPMNANERYQFACFIAGQDAPEIHWVGEDEVTVQAVGPLSKGRSRYNCTAPSKQKGRYYWHSKLWLTQAD